MKKTAPSNSPDRHDVWDAPGAMKERWGELTDADFDYIGRDWERLINRLQERYGFSREQALDEANKRFPNHDMDTDLGA